MQPDHSKPPVPPATVHYRETQFGFEYGAAKVTRLTDDEKRGWVVIGIETPRHTHHSLQVYVTKTGKVRVFSADGDWAPPQKRDAAARSSGREAGQ